MEEIKISIFERIFKSKKVIPITAQTELISNAPNLFTSWTGNAYENDIYRSTVDGVARNAAKLKGSHVIKYAVHTKSSGDCKLNRILQVQPNPYMSSFNMLYKLVIHYFGYNNAFAYIERNEKGGMLGMYPFKPLNVQFLHDNSENFYFEFLFGTPNTALNSALELAHTQNEGMSASIKSSANIRGILKFTQIMAPEKLK